ncbi:MAG: hypothetical protein QOI41_4247 [Myxococcales bacterium]|nr:hypothetical protein [Myxococcales bacterium]
MIASNRLPLALLLSSSIGVTALVSSACGGISDPTKGGEGRVATVSGALTGITVPANARVALVYRGNTAANASSHSVVVVGSDVPVVGGKFTMNLGVPADDLFSSVDAASVSTSAAPPIAEGAPSSTGSSEPSVGTSTSGSPGAFGAAQIAPRDLVGGQITQPLTAAVAGFVVYADTNGNGQLDLEGPYASSTDQILGGNRELFLVYLKGGGSLDYEKMRDKSGILPTAGFDLAWTQGRWLPLTDVELTLTANAQLPSTVCAASSGAPDTVYPSPVSSASDPAGASGGSSGTSGSAGVSATTDGGSGGGYYPSPSDPQLQCSADGRSYTYGDSPTTCTTPPAPTGLCAGDVYTTTVCAGSTGYGNALPPGAPVPDGWPCPTSTDLDGGGAPDGSTFDGGSADGGSADGG